MRLQAIKLAGFKSFVDSTTVSFPSNLCAVVGPNGCGKSNIIDAVRWVMGESSAKNLRGESMTDVIFNGASSRKPVGQASIELIFDNADGRVGGEFAAYSEVSVKRQVSRDGQSTYFLNKNRCRRKDITDLFLGTGLGPRSYSIIEQGMISQLIEARPEDLRIYIEEAAGISKYKERRRETERRISHTRDNLERLTDLREELERQLLHLERQAKAAERYKLLKQEEREQRAQLQVLRWRRIAGEAETQEMAVNRLTNDQEARIADERRVSADIEEQRSSLHELTDDANNIQREFYDLGTEIARIEDSIQYQSDRAQELAKDLEEARAGSVRVQADIEKDRHTLADLQAQLNRAEPEQKEASARQQNSSEELLAAEQAMQTWQVAWDSFNERAAETRNQGELQQTKISHLESTITRLDTSISATEAELTRLVEQDVESEIEPLSQMTQAQSEQLERMENELTDVFTRIDETKSDIQEADSALGDKRQLLSTLQGRFASLEALQQAALGQEDSAAVRWLQGQGFSGYDRLGEVLDVEPRWRVAVETALYGHLQAVVMDGVANVPQALASLEQGELAFVSRTIEKTTVAGGQWLIDQVASPVDLKPHLSGIRLAENLDVALSIQSTLSEHESVMTSDGIWLGRDWVRISRAAAEETGVIERQAELAALSSDIETLVSETDALTERLTSGRASLQLAEKERNDLQARIARQQHTHGETRAQLSAKQIQAEQMRHDIVRLELSKDADREELGKDHGALKEARMELHHAMDLMERDTRKKDSLLFERDEKQTVLEQYRQKARQDREDTHTLALRLQSLRSEVDAINAALTRLGQQRDEYEQRQQSLREAIANSEEPQADLRRELDAQLNTRLAVEARLTKARATIEATESRIRDHEQQRVSIEEQVETVRESLAQVRLDWQALETRKTTITEQLSEEGHDLATVMSALPTEADEDTWDANLTRTGNRIQRLGAINLAAIDEYQTQSERKTYLDAQNEDLEKALSTLENAIRRIDIETRTRFKETFDKINSKLQQLFPKLFGGGHAYLEMTGEDLLDTGVGLMARPPGKRNASIHALSGGEKALTAIALVFSIFSLNPAPFCLLDEVDAPLDDANVSRYSDLVKEMSRTVQFIFISHNKAAMEMAEQLIGVTMNEPGVSRLVTVDVDEAVAMAAV
ncbi:MAG: chromosome segregation protein SMC [Gammaproteobacteria bacterium]|nr:chromosome segregation protein SMC [Gammaproteobacteria bacterium]OUU07069.1 MAG: chromosome segregation protein SMC [Gammaproteobacteria bacterium TMED34]